VENENALSNPARDKFESDLSQSRSEVIDFTFEDIFSRHYARIVAVLIRLVGDRAQAEELADDVFWKLYKQPPSSGRKSNLGGWLYRTATHMGIDALRAAACRQRYEQAAASDFFEVGAPPDPLDEVLRAERQHRARATLARLKPAQAQLLILRYSGFSYKELADALGVKSSSIGTLLARAEAQFERLYRECRQDRE
jgi:RNA polymerase sigma-70 factor (ECF subfamily)